MCLLLADFLRRSLQLGVRESIPFGDELKLAESFLDIEKVRFGERLGIDQQVDPDCHSCMVPPLLIQPLIENAVTHGIAPMIEGGIVNALFQNVQFRITNEDAVNIRALCVTDRCRTSVDGEIKAHGWR